MRLYDLDRAEVYLLYAYHPLLATPFEIPRRLNISRYGAQTNRAGVQCMRLIAESKDATLAAPCRHRVVRADDTVCHVSLTSSDRRHYRSLFCYPQNRVQARCPPWSAYSTSLLLACGISKALLSRNRMSNGASLHPRMPSVANAVT